MDGFNITKSSFNQVSIPQENNDTKAFDRPSTKLTDEIEMKLVKVAGSRVKRLKPNRNSSLDEKQKIESIKDKKERETIQYIE